MPFGELMWYLSTQVNGSILSAYTIVFDLNRGNLRQFIPFLVYALAYPSIASNLVTLATPIPWSDFVYTHTCSNFLRKTLLRWYRRVKTGLLINW